MMRVLIADDSMDMTEMLAILLLRWQFEPILAHDGETALSILRGPDAPTLALLDWIMPGMSGIDVCREIRKDFTRPYTYTILVTGRGNKEQMLDGLEAGADDYLLKPVDAAELHARLQTGKRILALQDQLLKAQQKLEDMATHDSLTGLWNRGMILEILHRELVRSLREGHPVSVIMADIDHFKNINDTHGHLPGDHVLRQSGQRLLAALRPYDTVGRYGGEEFLIVLPGCGCETSLALAERLLHCAESAPIRADKTEIPVTFSMGVATWDGESSPQDLLRVADSALYRAKHEGRNRAVAAEVPAT